MAKKTTKAARVPRRWHVQLVNGERTITAVQMGVMQNGALVFGSDDDETHTVYAPGHWQFVEPETRDE